MNFLNEKCKHMLLSYILLVKLNIQANFYIIMNGVIKIITCLSEECRLAKIDTTQKVKVTTQNKILATLNPKYKKGYAHRWIANDFF